MEHTVLYLLLLCSTTSGCAREDDPDPYAQIIRHHHYFPSLKSCESMMADSHPDEVISPRDSLGRYHFSVKNASGEEVLSDKWWICRPLTPNRQNPSP